MPQDVLETLPVSQNRWTLAWKIHLKRRERNRREEVGKGKQIKIGLNEHQGFLTHELTSVARSAVPGGRRYLGLRLCICWANKSSKDRSDPGFIPGTRVLQATSVRIDDSSESLKSSNISFRNLNIQETFFTSCFKPQISLCCTSELRAPGKRRVRTLLLLSRLLADLFSQQSELALLTEVGSNGCCWNQCSECTLCAELLDP